MRSTELLRERKITRPGLCDSFAQRAKNKAGKQKSNFKMFAEIV